VRYWETPAHITKVSPKLRTNTDSYVPALGLSPACSRTDANTDEHSLDEAILGDLLIIALLLVSVLITVSSLDDAFIDLLAMGITRFRNPRLNQ
jgi:hypothetical protein